MNETLHAATASLERRIAEIDELLSETGPLRAEREHLARALEEVAAATGAGKGVSQEPRQASATRRAPSTGRASSRRRKRAPQGRNRERILAFLRDKGPASASAIARGTGINRAVVYNNLSKLTTEDAVSRSDGDDGTTLFRLAG